METLPLIAFFVALVLLVVVLVGFALAQALGEHEDNVDTHHRHGRA